MCVWVGQHTNYVAHKNILDHIPLLPNNKIASGVVNGYSQSQLFPANMEETLGNNEKFLGSNSVSLIFLSQHET